MVVVVEPLVEAIGAFSFGDTGASNQYFAQTFRAAGSQLDSVEFYFEPVEGPDATELRLLVTTVAFDGNGFHPGAVLFESPLLVFPLAQYPLFDFVTVKVDIGHLALQPGANYAFILDAFAAFDGQASKARPGFGYGGGALGTNYTDGYASSLSAAGGNRASHFAADWGDNANVDLAFRLTFSEPATPGVTIIGTKGKDIVDATTSVPGQPAPTAGNDVISGRGNKDRLSGLAGDDSIDGGKGKDTLFGEEGLDSFIFSVPPRDEPDKVMDFVPADDTLVLVRTKFKKLPLGVLSDAAFRDVGEAATNADRIIYKASGKVLYDKDGQGGADAVAFAKLIGAPDVAAVDFLVV